MLREQELEIIRQVQQGDSQAFEALVLAHQKNVYNLALRMVGNPDDAFDMAQETFLRAYRNLGSFRGDSRFSVWLYRLTSNLCIDFLRKQKRRKTGSLTYINEDQEVLELEIPDLRQEPERLLEQAEQRRALAEAMESLPEDYRQILTLRELNGLSYEEIAQVTALEAGTVKSRLFRARKRLCALLAQSGNFPGQQASKERKGV